MRALPHRGCAVHTAQAWGPPREKNLVDKALTGEDNSRPKALRWAGGGAKGFFFQFRQKKRSHLFFRPTPTVHRIRLTPVARRQILPLAALRACPARLQRWVEVRRGLRGAVLWPRSSPWPRPHTTPRESAPPRTQLGWARHRGGTPTTTMPVRCTWRAMHLLRARPPNVRDVPPCPYFTRRAHPPRPSGVTTSIDLAELSRPLDAKRQKATPAPGRASRDVGFGTPGGGHTLAFMTPTSSRSGRDSTSTKSSGQVKTPAA